jgi:Txe/YoeB family toxin of Txe-Axe toxin-antitoxin module
MSMRRHTDKTVQVVFGDRKVYAAYEKLKESDYADERELFRQIEEALDALKKDPFCGIEIPKKLIPREYARRYRVNNLWKYDLRGGWRLIYTNVSDEVKILAVVLEWFDHSNYEKRFGY